MSLVDADYMIVEKMAFGTTCAQKYANGKTDGTRYAEIGESL